MFLWWIIILILFGGILFGLGVEGLFVVLGLGIAATLATIGGVDSRRHHHSDPQHPHSASYYHPTDRQQSENHD